LCTDVRRAIGITTAEDVATGLVEDHQLAGPLRVYQETGDDPLLTMPPAGIAQVFAEEVRAVASGQAVEAIGIGMPGLIRNGFIEESPNLRQLKGAQFQELVSDALRELGIRTPVYVYNDADMVAAGLAATRGHLDRMIRVWTLGYGIGFGSYPQREGVWEGGHMVVSLDPRERFCGCGGVGHLEGIMGQRAMRLRFLDMEPDEVFENAHHGDPRCIEFVRLWHRALAAATANSIHLSGAGKFYLSGFNSRHLDLNLLDRYMHEMVKMSPLQSYAFEVVAGTDEISVVGAAVSALHAAFQVVGV